MQCPDAWVVKFPLDGLSSNGLNRVRFSRPASVTAEGLHVRSPFSIIHHWCTAVISLQGCMCGSLQVLPSLVCIRLYVCDTQRLYYQLIAFWTWKWTLFLWRHLLHRVSNALPSVEAHANASFSTSTLPTWLLCLWSMTGISCTCDKLCS